MGDQFTSEGGKQILLFLHSSSSSSLLPADCPPRTHERPKHKPHAFRKSQLAARDCIELLVVSRLLLLLVVVVVLLSWRLILRAADWLWANNCGRQRTKRNLLFAFSFCLFCFFSRFSRSSFARISVDTNLGAFREKKKKKKKRRSKRRV